MESGHLIGSAYHCPQGSGSNEVFTPLGNQKALHRQIRSKFQGKRHVP
jgi:hypothetical protein